MLLRSSFERKKNYQSFLISPFTLSSRLPQLDRPDTNPLPSSFLVHILKQATWFLFYRFIVRTLLPRLDRPLSHRFFPLV